MTPIINWPRGPEQRNPDGVIAVLGKETVVDESAWWAAYRADPTVRRKINALQGGADVDIQRLVASCVSIQLGEDPAEGRS